MLNCLLFPFLLLATFQCFCILIIPCTSLHSLLYQFPCRLTFRCFTFHFFDLFLFSVRMSLNCFLLAMKAYYAIHVHFVEAMRTDTLREKVTVLELAVRHFLKCVLEVDFSAMISISEIIKGKAETSFRLYEKSMSVKNHYTVWKVIGTEQGRQTLQASLSFET